MDQICELFQNRFNSRAQLLAPPIRRSCVRLVLTINTHWSHHWPRSFVLYEQVMHLYISSQLHMVHQRAWVVSSGAEARPGEERTRHMNDPQWPGHIEWACMHVSVPLKLARTHHLRVHAFTHTTVEILAPSRKDCSYSFQNLSHKECLFSSY
jgi:hypothetical protein